MDRGGEVFGLARGIRNTLSGSEILEMTGVAHRYPPRAGRLSEITVPLGHHPDRAVALSAGEFGPRLSAEVLLALAVKCSGRLMSTAIPAMYSPESVGPPQGPRMIH